MNFEPTPPEVSSATGPGRFSAVERRRLLMANGIGERLVDVLEAAGFSSIEQLRRRGAEGVIEASMKATGSTALRCRIRPLRRVLMGD